VGFGWLTRLGSPFLKIFWTDISKNLDFFLQGPLEIAREAGENCSLIAADTAVTTTVGERHESLDRACCSGLLVRHVA
jgi:hypothetical protein